MLGFRVCGVSFQAGNYVCVQAGEAIWLGDAIWVWLPYDVDCVFGGVYGEFV